MNFFTKITNNKNFSKRLATVSISISILSIGAAFGGNLYSSEKSKSYIAQDLLSKAPYTYICKENVIGLNEQYYGLSTISTSSAAMVVLSLA